MSKNVINTSWTKSINEAGEFKRPERSFRNFVTADGSSGFKAEPDRYHLYVSLACPWAHRTLILRRLKGLEHVISYNVVDWFLDTSTGWSFKKSDECCTGDTVNGFQYLKEVYLSVQPDYSDSFTVPVLWDKKTKTIVNNESSEIIRMLNKEFNEFATNKELDLYPQNLKEKIDEINSWVYTFINNGVYKAGFAKSQSAYDKAVQGLFEHLDRVEDILSKNRYLCGDNFTEADVRLFTTLYRFDPVYTTHFKCNIKRLIDYPNIWDYTRDIYQMGRIKETCNMVHCKNHYYKSHVHINPFGIVPAGPLIDYNVPTKRAKQFSSQ